MSYRSLNSTLQTSLLNGDAYGYAHLIKFEKPIPGTELKYSERTKPSRKAINYAYLTDGAYDIKFNDGSSDASENPNGEQNYLANKVLKVGSASETIQAKATTMSLVLPAEAIGISVVGTFSFTSSTITAPSGTDWVSQGFQEGDTVKFTGNGSNADQIVRIDSFTTSNTKITYTLLSKDDGSISSITTQNSTYTATHHSAEINALTTLKSDPSFSSYLNREVFIYRAHINPSTGAIIGGDAGVFLLFKGIITGGKLQEDPLKGSKITWNLTSHWGDFVQIKGRTTSDAAHRGLNTGGVTDEEAVFRPEYASDLGFYYGDQAVNVAATYQVFEDKVRVEQSGGFFKGDLLSLDNTYIDKVPVDRDVDLAFNIKSRYLPVVYGVQKIGGIPFFADGLKENAKIVYIASALCEGPIHSIMDIHVDDEPLVCMNSADAAERESDASEARVICFGRAEKGDVLLGDNARVDPAVKSQQQAILDEINSYTAQLQNDNGSRSLDHIREALAEAQADLGAVKETIANFVGQNGLTHDKYFTFTSPMDTYFNFHAGRADQASDGMFTEIGGQGLFKLQSMYHTDKPNADYWGPNHRVLDTAYIAQQFTINAEEFTVPKTNYVVKGRVLDCFNYDRSYFGGKAASDSSTTHADFLLGDYVKLFNNNGTRLNSGSLTDETVQIIDKFSFYTDDGEVQYRYRFSKNLHLKEDNDNLSADLDHFYMEHLTVSSKRWYFVAQNAAIEKDDGSGLIRNLPLPTQQVFKNTTNSGIAFANATQGVLLKNGIGESVPIKTMTGFPTNDAELAMGKMLSFSIRFGIQGAYRTFTIPYENYQASTGTLSFPLEHQPLARSIESFFERANQAISAGNPVAKWAITVSDVIKLSGSLSSTDDVYNRSTLTVHTIHSSGNKIRHSRRIEDYDASEALVRVGQRESLTFSSYPTTEAEGRSGATFRFDIEGSIDIDTAAFNALDGKGADRRVSINPAIQLLDYLTNDRYGKGLDIENDIDKESFLAAARFCDSRSDVTMVVKTSTLTTTPTAGAVYKYPSTGSPILFQGTVKGTPVTYDVTGVGDSSRTNFTQIVFTDVIGQLGRKWNDYRTYEASRHVIYHNGSAFAASSTGTMNATARDTAITNNLLTGVGLTRVSGTGDDTVTINVERKFGFAGNGNPVVRQYAETSGTFAAMGYSLYDGDDCTYWKYLGWEEQEQRNVTRHQTNIIINTSEPVFQNVNVLLSQFNGMLRYGNGKYSLEVKQKEPTDAHFNTFSGKVINEEDIIGAISIDDGSSKKKLNQISANIIDPSLRFGGRGITFTNSDYIKQDRGIKKEGNLSATGITNYFNARMAVKQLLDESRFGITAKFTIDSSGYLLQAGDIIRINYSRFNWTNKAYRIESLNFSPNGNVQVVAKEHNDDAYTAEYVDDFKNSNNLDGGSQGGRSFTAPGAPTGGAATTDQAGRVKLTWTNGTEFVPTVQATQVARHPTNVTPNAAGSNVTIIADTQQDNFIDTAPGDFASGDVSHYYWVRHAYSRNHGHTASVERNKFTAWLALGLGTAKITTKVEVEGGVDIETGGVTFPSNPSGNPSIKAGQSDFDTGTGFFLGRHSSAYKLSVGNSSGNKLTFDGTNLNVTGTITASDFQGGTLGQASGASNRIPTTIFSRSIADSKGTPTGSESGGFIDLTNGNFVFGDATSFISFSPTLDNNTARKINVKGDIVADNLHVNEAISAPNLTSGSVAADSVGVSQLKEEVFREIEERLGNTGGYYAAFETGVTDNTAGFLGQGIGSPFIKELNEVSGESSGSGFTHAGEKTILNFSINDQFAAPRSASSTGRDAKDLEINIVIEKAPQGTTNYSAVGAIETVSATETVLTYSSQFNISKSFTREITTSGSHVEGSAYIYRVKIYGSTQPGGSVYRPMFAVYDASDSNSGANDSSGSPILFEVREGTAGTSAGGVVVGSSGDISGEGDPDTKITFNTDEIVLQAGGETMATFTEGASDTITLHKDTTVSTNLTVSGNATITGTLQVDGTTTTVNSQTLDVVDKNITVAKNASNKAAADGAGLTVDIGTNDPVISAPTFTYTQSDDSWNMNKDLRIVTAIADATFQVGRDANNQYLQLHVTDGNNTITAKQDADENSAHSFILNRDFAGTSTTNDFRIQKAGSTQLLIDTDGQVGIGTTSPAGNLHIKSVNNVGDALLIIEADADNNVETDNPRIELRQDNNLVTGAIYMEGNAGVTATSTLANSLIFDAKASSTAGSHSMQFVTGGLAANQSGGPTNGSVKMTIMDSGNIGIGTNAPTKKLHIRETSTTPQTELTSLYVDQNLSDADPEVALTGDRTARGIFVDVDSTVSSGDTDDEHRIYGIASDIDVNSDGDSDLAYGILSHAQVNSNAGSTSALRGYHGHAVNHNEGTHRTNVTMGGHFLADHNSESNTADAQSYYGSNNIARFLAGATGHAQNMYGAINEVEINPADGTAGTVKGSIAATYSLIDNNDSTDDEIEVGNSFLFYGTYSPNDTGFGNHRANTRSYGIYIASDVPNYFVGKVGINTGASVPTYQLDIGKATSSTDNTIRIAQANGGTAIRIGTGSGDSDVTLLRVDGHSTHHNGESDNSQFGFSLKYKGSGNQNANSLSLFSDNQQGTAVEAVTVFQDGSVGINQTSPAARVQIEDLGIETTSTAVSSTNATVVDTFAKATFRTARYTVQITQGSAYQCSDIMAIHDGTTAIGTEYAMLETGSVLGTLDVAINGDNVELSVTMAAADAATVKVIRHCVAV